MITPKFILVACDGTKILVDKDVASQSMLLQKMMEALGMEQSTEEELPIVSVDGPALEKIVEWCTAHRKEPARRKEATENPYTVLTKDDQKYLAMDCDLLSDVLAGANYLDIPGLVDICLQQIANLASGKTVVELREMLCLENDFRPEEEEKLFNNVKWVN